MHPDEWVPPGPEGALDDAAKVIGVVGRLKPFEYGEFQAVYTSGPREKQGNPEQRDAHVVNTIGVFNRVDDAAELVVSGNGKG
jgi:hypothetical protein